MPEITVSEDLYRQIETEAAAGDEDVEHTMWRMVSNYRRESNPGC
jgi:hypothetical protein